MKTIKKTSRSYKFLIWTLSYEPKNTCEFYFYIFIAILFSPFVAIANFYDWSLNFTSRYDKDGPEIQWELFKRQKDVWDGIGFTMFAIIFTVLFASLAAFMLIPFCLMFGMDEKNQNTLFYILTVAILFIGPLIIKVGKKVFKYVKSNCCKPINYSE